MRTIVQSRTYQLSAGTNATNRADEVNYSRRGHGPSTPWCSSMPSRGSRVSRRNSPGTPSSVAGPARPGARAIDLVPEIAPCRFLDAYGRPNRQALPERTNQPNIAQALHMLAGPTYTEKIAHKGGRVDRLVEGGASNREAIEELYLAALRRLPTERERSELDVLIGKQPTRREALEALAWALISSREFAYNH